MGNIYIPTNIFYIWRALYSLETYLTENVSEANSDNKQLLVK